MSVLVFFVFLKELSKMPPYLMAFHVFSKFDESVLLVFIQKMLKGTVKLIHMGYAERYIRYVVSGASRKCTTKNHELNEPP
jgi:hypothetical protein